MNKKIRVTDKLIEQVVTELIGEEAISIVKYLKGKKNVSEFKIAEGVKEEIHKTRNILYRLLENNLVTFKRKKDKQKGWYICYWDFHPHKVKYALEKLNKTKLENLKERLTREQDNHFFMCKSACVRMDFEKASDFNFKCPECGELMNQLDNARTIDFLKEQIGKLEKEVKEAA